MILIPNWLRGKTRLPARLKRDDLFVVMTQPSIEQSNLTQAIFRVTSTCGDSIATICAYSPVGNGWNRRFTAPLYTFQLVTQQHLDALLAETGTTP